MICSFKVWWEAANWWENFKRLCLLRILLRRRCDWNAIRQTDDRWYIIQNGMCRNGRIYYALSLTLSLSPLSVTIATAPLFHYQEGLRLCDSFQLFRIPFIITNSPLQYQSLMDMVHHNSNRIRCEGTPMPQRTDLVHSQDLQIQPMDISLFFDCKSLEHRPIHFENAIPFLLLMLCLVRISCIRSWHSNSNKRSFRVHWASAKWWEDSEWPCLLEHCIEDVVIDLLFNDIVREVITHHVAAVHHSIAIAHRPLSKFQ